jgi:hypothetical protein
MSDNQTLECDVEHHLRKSAGKRDASAANAPFEERRMSDANTLKTFCSTHLPPLEVILKKRAYDNVGKGNKSVEWCVRVAVR